jgi:hypothetical protein
MNSAHSSPHGMKAKLLAVALGLCLASTAHSPRVEASGMPVFDAANLTQMLLDWAKDAITDCFTVDSMKEGLQRIQDIQQVASRVRVMSNMTELMPERDELEGIEACPNPSGGSLAASAAGWASTALGVGSTSFDGTTDLRTLQQQLCASQIMLENRKWNAERDLLLELEEQAADYEGIMNKWNAMADMKGQIEAVCNPVPGGSMSFSGGEANEGKQNSMQQELAQNAAANNQALSDHLAKLQVIDGAIGSIKAKQAEVGQRMLNGEGDGLLTGAAAGAIQATLLNAALETAKSQ